MANFAETEMVLAKSDGSIASYVQIRGSIPLYWDQLVTLKYMPRTKYAFSGTESVQDWNELAFNRHFTTEIERYGTVTVINLIDKIGTSGTVKDQFQLGTAFSKYAKRYGSDFLVYIWFDFHHECRKLAWHNLSKLITLVQDVFPLQGCFKMDAAGSVSDTQKGIFRTNCMDNLDRTNVVQSLFARRALLMALNAFDPKYPNVLDSPYASFERIFKNIWADNADAVSFMYAGTGALKTDFTRTGKRTVAGALQDGKNSLMRYYLNNFHDGKRQDAYDLLVGNYIPNVFTGSPFTLRQRYPLLLFLLEGIPVVISLAMGMEMYASEKYFQWIPIRWTTIFVATFIVGFFAIFAIGKKGYGTNYTRHMVCKPALCTTGYPAARKLLTGTRNRSSSSM